MQEGNYVKLFRSILEWEWYENINTCRLFIHMFLKANWKDGKFQGTTVPRGSFVSSTKKLSEETKLTEREIRTAISNLKKTGEVASKSTNKYTVFTVVNYDLYQTNDIQNDTQTTFKRHSNDILTTTIEERKERKKGRREEEKKKEVPKGTEKKEPVIYYPNDEKLNTAFGDFVQMRKQIKKPMTDRAITLMMNKLEKLSKVPFSDATDNDLAIKMLEQSIVKSWSDIYPLKEDNGSKKDGTIDWSTV